MRIRRVAAVSAGALVIVAVAAVGVEWVLGKVPTLRIYTWRRLIDELHVTLEDSSGEDYHQVLSEITGSCEKYYALLCDGYLPASAADGEFYDAVFDFLKRIGRAGGARNVGTSKPGDIAHDGELLAVILMARVAEIEFAMPQD